MSDTIEEVTRLADDPITRRTVLEVPIEEMEQELEAKRTRRLALITKLKEKAQVRATAHDMALLMRFHKIEAEIRKGLDKVDDAIDALEQKLNKLRALKMELED